MANPLERYAEMATGLAHATVTSAERVVQRLVKEGEVAADRVERLVSDLVEASIRNGEALGQLVRQEVDQAVERLGLVRRSDLDALEQRLLQRMGSTRERVDDGATSAAGEPAP